MNAAALRDGNVLAGEEVLVAAVTGVRDAAVSVTVAIEPAAAVAVDLLHGVSRFAGADDEISSGGQVDAAAAREIAAAGVVRDLRRHQDVAAGLHFDVS